MKENEKAEEKGSILSMKRRPVRPLKGAKATGNRAQEEAL